MVFTKSAAGVILPVSTGKQELFQTIYTIQFVQKEGDYYENKNGSRFDWYLRSPG